MKTQQRKERLLPNGQPKYVRCYDNGGTDKENGTFDQYTVVFTGNYRRYKTKELEKTRPRIICTLE